ncbi:hypothetical protein AOQ84DRAFT_222967, partial [Glonium stellatum]
MQLLTLASIAALAALPNLALSASFNVSPPGTSTSPSQSPIPPNLPSLPTIPPPPPP